jgi:hypothetical protein
MTGRGKVPAKRLDHVDRKSQVGVSGALRARDVSRPDDALVADVTARDGPKEAEAPRPPRTG